MNRPPVASDRADDQAPQRAPPRARIGELELAARHQLVLGFVAMIRTLNARTAPHSSAHDRRPPGLTPAAPPLQVAERTSQRQATARPPRPKRHRLRHSGGRPAALPLGHRPRTSSALGRSRTIAVGFHSRPECSCEFGSEQPHGATHLPPGSLGLVAISVRRLRRQIAGARLLGNRSEASDGGWPSATKPEFRSQRGSRCPV